MIIMSFIQWFEMMLEHHWDFDIDTSVNLVVAIIFIISLIMLFIQDIKEIMKNE